MLILCELYFLCSIFFVHIAAETPELCNAVLLLLRPHQDTQQSHGMSPFWRRFAWMRSLGISVSKQMAKMNEEKKVCIAQINTYQSIQASHSLLIFWYGQHTVPQQHSWFAAAQQSSGRSDVHLHFYIHSWYLSWSHDGTCISRKSFLGAFLSLHMLCLTLLPVTGCSSKQDSTRLQVANICKWNHFQLQFQMRVSQQPHQPASQTFAIRTRLLWDTLHLILGGTETMFSGSLPSPQWCPSSSHSHFFRIAFYILAIYTYVHICLCVCVSCVFLLAIQSQIITWIALHSFSHWWSNLNARTTNPSSLMQNLKYAPYETKSCQIPGSFQSQKCFNVTKQLRNKTLYWKSKLPPTDPHQIHTESTATPPSLLRFLQPVSSIRWKADRVALSQWKNSASACFARRFWEKLPNEQQMTARMFCNMKFQQRETRVFIQCLWSSKFIEALEMPNSWGIPMKGSEGQRRQGIAMCFRSVKISGWIAINA